jgi:hypothetical protein
MIWDRGREGRKYLCLQNGYSLSSFIIFLWGQGGKAGLGRIDELEGRWNGECQPLVVIHSTRISPG